MVKKEKSKKKKRRTNTILLTFIILAIVSVIVFNLPDTPYTGGEERCNVSAGYEWNETVKYCLKESEITYCEPEDRERDVCMQLYSPVCGFTQGGGKETFSNSCFACSNPEVKFHVPGECKNESKE